MAVIVGGACVVLFMCSLFSELMRTSLSTRLLYVTLPTALLLGFSIVFAQWHRGAARVFIWLSVPMFYVPIVFVVLLVAQPQASTFGAMGVVSLLALLQVASWTCRRQ